MCYIFEPSIPLKVPACQISFLDYASKKWFTLLCGGLMLSLFRPLHVRYKGEGRAVCKLKSVVVVHDLSLAVFSK